MKHSIIIIVILTLLYSFGFSQSNSPQKIIAKNPETQKYFGESGDIDNEYAVVCGIHSRNPVSSYGGVANIYKQAKDGKWKLTRTMYPKTSNIEDRFGQNACAISDNYVIVGDWMNAKQSCGAAHIFKFWGDTLWEEVAYLTPKDTAGIKSFGKSVDIHGGYAIVGADQTVYIFELQASGDWKQIKKIHKPNSGGFGNNVAIYNDFILVSAEWQEVNEEKNAGTVYVYSKDKQEGWKYFQKIQLDKKDVKTQAKFGNSISIYKNKILIGYSNCDMGEIPGAGMAYLYERDNDKFELKQKLYAYDFGYNKYHFGDKVSISDNFLVVSENQSREHKGSVYIFEKIEDEYIEVDRFISPIRSYHGNDFGQNGLALDGNNLFVGAPGDGFCGEELSACGSAYFYTLQKTPSKVNKPPFVPEGMTQSMITKKMKEFEADSILFDYINHDDVYLLRSKETGLWGMYQSGKVIIPMEYEHINFYGWNAPFTFAKKNGEWCIYYGGFSDEENAVYCGYDEVKKLEYKDYLYVAAKKNGKWNWVNWYSGNTINSNKEYYQELRIYGNWNPGNYTYFNIER